MKIVKIYENEKDFDEIMSICYINMDIASWDYASDSHSGYNYNASPLIGKKTGHHVGWLVYREWRNAEGEITDETYISIGEGYRETDHSKKKSG